jgi:histidinol-phosphate aminotransferase
LAGLRIGYGLAAPELAKTLWSMQLPFGMSITSAVAVAASYDAEARLRQRIQLITGQRRYLQRGLCVMGIYSIDSHANFVYLPGARWSWRDVFDNAGLKARHYADGGARITIGGPASTRAVLEVVRNRLLPEAECGAHRLNANAKVTEVQDHDT